MIASLIAYVASTTGLSCQHVFLEAIVRTTPRVVRTRSEHDELKIFAYESCRTQNPDALWIIARQETGFRFNIIRFNMRSGAGKVVEGEKAIAAKKQIQSEIDAGSKRARQLNADIGVMQVNLGYHGKSFGHNLANMMDPRAQVRFVTENFVNTLYKTCGKEWSACYHSGTEWRKAKYSKSLEGIRKSLVSTLFAIGTEFKGGEHQYKLRILQAGIVTPREIFGRLSLDSKKPYYPDEVANLTGPSTRRDPIPTGTLGPRGFKAIVPEVVAVTLQRKEDELSDANIPKNPIH